MSLFKAILPILLVSASLYSAEVKPLYKPQNKKVEVPSLDLDALKSGELAAHPNSVADLFGQSVSSGYSVFGYYPSGVTLLPYAQDITYSSDVLCHVANYTYVTVVTMLSGSTYGYQVIMTPSGYILSTNDIYFVDSNAYGLYLRHEYYDVSIVTGTDQVVYFK